jgi:predicted small lipoprotein YifL
MRHFVSLAGALSLAACGAFGPDKLPQAKGPLDNKTFTAQMVRDGNSEPAELVFRSGTFRSTSADKLAFPSTKYTAIQDGDFMRFEAVATSPDAGTMTWKGTVIGKTVEGTVVWDETWYRPDREYRFKGKLKD